MIFEINVLKNLPRLGALPSCPKLIILEGDRQLAKRKTNLSVDLFQTDKPSRQTSKQKKEDRQGQTEEIYLYTYSK